MTSRFSTYRTYEHLLLPLMTIFERFERFLTNSTYISYLSTLLPRSTATQPSNTKSPSNTNIQSLPTLQYQPQTLYFSALAHILVPKSWLIRREQYLKLHEFEPNHTRDSVIIRCCCNVAIRVRLEVLIQSLIYLDFHAEFAPVFSAVFTHFGCFTLLFTENTENTKNIALFLQIYRYITISGGVCRI